MTAAAALSLTGRYALQGQQSARGLQVWADVDDVVLQIVDDGNSPLVAVDAYRGWMSEEVDVLLGPYGSGQTRRVCPDVVRAGRLLWNHGGAADDLARPGVVSVAAPASTYFHGLTSLAHSKGVKRVVVAEGAGRFAATVSRGAAMRARDMGMELDVVSLAAAPAEAHTDVAMFAVGRFEDDVAVVRKIREEQDRPPALLGCVAAGLPDFARRLGRLADGVVGPVQWVPRADSPSVGPSGTDFFDWYLSRFGVRPSYVAAQAAAAGFLAADATRRNLSPDQIGNWRSTTLLGSFALDDRWRQTGHAAATIQWRQGRQQVIEQGG